MLKESQDQLIHLSNRLKELDTRTPKKLYCSLAMSKLLLKYFNIMNQLNVQKDEMDEEEEEDDEEAIKKRLQESDADSDDGEEEPMARESVVKAKKEKKRKSMTISKAVVDEALEATSGIPDHEIVGAMLMQMSKLKRDMVFSRRR